MLFIMVKDGLQFIADSVHNKTKLVADYLEKAGFNQLNSSYFDTFWLK